VFTALSSHSFFEAEECEASEHLMYFTLQELTAINVSKRVRCVNRSF